MLTQDEIKSLNHKVDIAALLTFLGAPIENLKVQRSNNGFPYDYRINAWWRGGDNIYGCGITYDFTREKWLVSDFTGRSCGNYDLIDFMTRVLKYSFRKAIDTLVFASGKENGFTMLKGIDAPRKTSEPVAIDKEVLDIFESGNLHPYWAARGFDPKVAKYFRLGFCAPDYELLKGRLTIPIYDEKQRLVAIQGRTTNDQEEPKYLYADARQGESAKLCLYNYPLAKVHSMSRGWLGVVESANSVWRAFQYEYYNFVATLSTSVTDRQLQLLIDLKQNVVIFSDRDVEDTAAGQTAAIKLANRLKEHGVRVWLAIPPFYGDPSDLVKDTFELCLKHAKEY